MPASMPSQAIGRLVQRMPLLKRLPVLRLLALGEVLLLAREHLERLEPHERRRLVALIRAGRGRPRNLSVRDREELQSLIAKADPRLFAGLAAQKLSPVPIPDRFVRGPGKRA
ncbi:MAG: hypothetical protein ACYC91_04185 [Solirubrobacteraceae bacterium]